MIKTDQGFSSIQFLLMLLFFSALIFGTNQYLHSQSELANRSKRLIGEYREMDELLAEVLKSLKDDPSPEQNDKTDPIWSWDQRQAGDYRISVNPISDRVNINYLSPSMLKASGLSRFLKNGKDGEEFSRFREEAGLRSTVEDYDEFFPQEILAAFFGVHSWGNINTIDEAAARRLALSVSGSEVVADFVGETIADLRRHNKTLRREELKETLGDFYGDLFPFLNCEAPMNINFVEPEILEALIACLGKDLAIPGDPRQLILPGEGHPLSQYLGRITWFFEINIEGPRRSCRAIVCRIPPAGSLNPEQPGAAVYKIIEQRFI